MELPITTLIYCKSIKRLISIASSIESSLSLTIRPSIVGNFVGVGPCSSVNCIDKNNVKYNIVVNIIEINVLFSSLYQNRYKLKKTSLTTFQKIFVLSPLLERFSYSELNLMTNTNYHFI